MPPANSRQWPDRRQRFNAQFVIPLPSDETIDDGDFVPLL